MNTATGKAFNGGENLSASAVSPIVRDWLKCVTGLGIATITFIPMPQSLLVLLQGASGWSWLTTWAVGATLWCLGAAGLLLLFVLLVERLPLRCVGFRRLSWMDAAAVAFAVVCCISIDHVWGRVLDQLLRQPMAQVATPSGGFDYRAIAAPLLFFVILSDSVIEELGDRAYAIERVSALSGSISVGAVVSYGFNVLGHIPALGVRGAVFVAPGTLALLGLYLWRRNVFDCILAHVLLDSYVLLWR